MSGNVSLGYMYQYNLCSSYNHCNDNGIYDYKILGVYVGYGKRGYRYIETSNSPLAIVDFIMGVMMIKVDIGLKRPATIHLSIV